MKVLLFRVAWVCPPIGNWLEKIVKFHTKSRRQLDHSSSSLKNLPTIDPRISFSIFSGQQYEKTFNHSTISYSNRIHMKTRYIMEFHTKKL